jgi:hypothetical protein
MDDRQFDSMTRLIGAGRSRRAVLAGLLGLAGLPLADGVEAARRSSPTPTPVKCPGNQHWDGSKCVCSEGTTCGPDCCTQDSVCCDNACCYGHCYGEELCCPTGSVVVEGACFSVCAGELLACPDACGACVIIEETSPLEICANVFSQGCSDNADCAHLGSGWVCSPFGNQCLQPC